MVDSDKLVPYPTSEMLQQTTVKADDGFDVQTMRALSKDRYALHVLQFINNFPDHVHYVATDSVSGAKLLHKWIDDTGSYGRTTLLVLGADPSSLQYALNRAEQGQCRIVIGTFSMMSHGWATRQEKRAISATCVLTPVQAEQLRARLRSPDAKWFGVVQKYLDPQ